MACDRTCVNHDIIPICSGIIEDVFRYLLIVEASRATHRSFSISFLIMIKSAQNLLRKANIIVLFLGSLFKIIFRQIIAEKSSRIASILSTTVD